MVSYKILVNSAINNDVKIVINVIKNDGYLTRFDEIMASNVILLVNDT